jgi:hypothetical protein
MIFTSSNISQSGVIQIPGFTFKVPSFLNPLTSQQAYLGFKGNQDQNYIYIKKLELFGLVPKVNNTAESLFAGLINRLIITVSDKRIEAEIFYWGAFTEDGVVTKTIEIKLYNLLSVVKDEIQYNNIISPMDY